MDILNYKLVTAVEGATSISTGGLNLSQLIKVARQGIQHDYTAFVNLSTMSGREWTFIAWSKRVVFNSEFPFVANEKIYLIYKTSI